MFIFVKIEETSCEHACWDNCARKVTGFRFPAGPDIFLIITVLILALDPAKPLSNGYQALSPVAGV
jgi:hypothetical protein